MVRRYNVQENKKLLVCYPSGAGGRWLGNLIDKLETNQSDAESEQLVNFHSKGFSNNVMICHYPMEEQPDANYDYVAYFNGSCNFNIYLNAIEKYYIKDSNSIYPIQLSKDNINECEVMYLEALNKINYPQEVDLDYDCIYKDPMMFVEQLYRLLDHCNFEYTKNTELCLRSIQQFKQSCVRPTKYFKNYENPVWLAWCIAVLDHLGHEKISFKDFEELRSILYPEHSVIEQFTMDRKI